MRYLLALVFVFSFGCYKTPRADLLLRQTKTDPAEVKKEAPPKEGKPLTITAYCASMHIMYDGEDEALYMGIELCASNPKTCDAVVAGTKDFWGSVAKIVISDCKETDVPVDAEDFGGGPVT